MSCPSAFSRFFGAVILAGSFFVVPCFGDSQARVVRLSDVQGDVTIDRNTGEGFEKAFLNLPITQGVKVRTGSEGRAELEFEDSSTLRITPDSQIDVPELSLRESGAKVSSIHLLKGTVYINFNGRKDDEFNLKFARETVTLTGATHLRVELDDADASLAVLKGDVEVTGPSGSFQVSRNHSVNFDLANSDHYQVAKAIEENPFDAWDKQQTQYAQRYQDDSYSNYSPYAYGTSDLNYYGNFFSLPGYGMLWQPYLIGTGWDPFMNGAWAFYPGFGYGWVSAYPWGWTPYHYGSWVYLPLYGWAWQPGGAWMGWNTIPVYVNAPVTFIPPRTPNLPGKRIVVVNSGPVPVHVGASSTRLQIPSNSAGIGIPRGSVRNLGTLSQTVQEHGSAVTSLHTGSVGGLGWWHGGYSEGGRSGFAGAHTGSVSASSGHSSGSSGGHSSGGHR